MLRRNFLILPFVDLGGHVSSSLKLGIEKGTQLWLLLGIAAALGSLLTGYIADKIGFAKSIRISLLIKAIGVILPLMSTSIWNLAASSVFVGSLALGISSLAAGRTGELVSQSHQKKVWSYMTVTYSVAHALTVPPIFLHMSKLEPKLKAHKMEFPECLLFTGVKIKLYWD
ncbi:YbfB/YjiJ family MFS transporter [Galbibacter orientalis]|uniref:YbfB/YjiJ family MFS transporter n=1 Tax=Galbibacter orientalis TaxID=453852 RepID=UPI003AB91EE5